MNQQATPIRVAALYKFVRLEKPIEFKAALEDLCAKNDVMGTLLLAQEGINGTIAGPEDGLERVLNWIRQRPQFSGIDIKYSESREQPFNRMKVRMKKEIVTLGVEGVDPTQDVGTYVDPEDWNDLISREDVIVVDTRNAYETAIGTFEGAIDPETESFRELPVWVDEELGVDRKTPVAMFCTGGIRCEKSTALLKAKGFENVYHLKGGILKYLEEVPEEESLWQGECFVFDQRVSVGHGLKQGDYDLCHACRRPIDEDDKASPHYEIGVSCPNCVNEKSSEQRARFAERQHQIELARQRSTSHIAADVEQEKARKAAEREEHRRRSNAGTIVQ